MSCGLSRSAVHGSRLVRALSPLPLCNRGSSKVVPVLQQAFAYRLYFSSQSEISSYDAAYLELACRLGAGLATLDKDLERAARKSGVALFR